MGGLWRGLFLARGVLLPRLPNRSDGPVHEHVQRAKFDVEELGALLAASIFQQPQSEDAGIARVHLFKARVDLCPQIRAKEPLLHRVGIGSRGGLQVLQVGAA